MNPRFSCRPSVLFLVLALLPAAGLSRPAESAADKHPFGLDDYSALRRARAVAVSPDGKAVLYQVSFDGTKGLVKHEWHLVDISAENSRKLELLDAFEPAGFTKDGGALFGSYEVDKKGQLGIVPIGGTKPTQIISLPNGIQGTWISPDGSKFAFTSDPRPADPLVDVRHVAENDTKSIYVAGASGLEGAWWCPELKDVAALAWFADSSQLAVVTQYQKIGHHDVRSSLWVCSSSGARKVADIPNSVSGIAWANGGKDLAFASTTRYGPDLETAADAFLRFEFSGGWLARLRYARAAMKTMFRNRGF
jgi:dipeptidyl aminopeptidase/acylaminoacyl peptidase